MVDSTYQAEKKVDLNTYPLQPEALQAFPMSVAIKYNIMPLALNKNTLTVAMADINNMQAIQEMAIIMMKRIIPLPADPDQIRRSIEYYYKTKSYSKVEKQLSKVAPRQKTVEMVRVISEDVSHVQELEKIPLISWCSDTLFRIADFGAYADSGSYTNLWDYLFILSFLYETGAILGYTRCDNRLLLEKMARETKNSYLLDDYEKMAEEHLRGYRNQSGKEPETFYEFVFKEELKNVIGPDPRNHPQWTVANPDKKLNKTVDYYWKSYRNLLDEKVKLKRTKHGFLKPARADDEAKVARFTLEGIGFGAAFPELTERMNHNFWKFASDNFDRLSKEWKRIYPPVTPLVDYCQYLPEDLTILSFEEQQKRILSLLASFVNLAYRENTDSMGNPKWLEFLDLQSYTPKAQRTIDTVHNTLKAGQQYEDWFKFARFNEGEKAFLPVNYLNPIGAHII